MSQGDKEKLLGMLDDWHTARTYGTADEIWHAHEAILAFVEQAGK